LEEIAYVGPTMRDVAALAGVSVATVSRSLAGSPGVAPEVRERVRRAADELGYYASRLPANLRSKGVRILALVVGNVRNTYFPELIDGCLEAAHASGYPLIFGDSDEDPEREEEVLHQLATERVAGVAVASADGWSRGLDRLQEIGIPVVAVDRRLPRLQVDTVTVESERAVYEAMQHLLALGHRRIGLMAGPPGLSTLAERQAGYERALIERGIDADPSLIIHGDLRQAT
jgi:LacI family transcriptional regulator